MASIICPWCGKLSSYAEPEMHSPEYEDYDGEDSTDE